MDEIQKAVNWTKWRGKQLDIWMNLSRHHSNPFSSFGQVLKVQIKNGPEEIKHLRSLIPLKHRYFHSGCIRYLLLQRNRSVSFGGIPWTLDMHQHRGESLVATRHITPRLFSADRYRYDGLYEVVDVSMMSGRLYLLSCYKWLYCSRLGEW